MSCKIISIRKVSDNKIIISVNINIIYLSGKGVREKIDDIELNFIYSKKNCFNSYKPHNGGKLINKISKKFGIKMSNIQICHKYNEQNILLGFKIDYTPSHIYFIKDDKWYNRHKSYLRRGKISELLQDNG